MTYLGLRPGEKLYEELLVKTEELDKTPNSMIFIERDTPLCEHDIDTLARCNGLIAGVSNVSFFVMVINKAEGRAFNDCTGFLNTRNESRNYREKIYISYDSTNKNCQAGDIKMVEFGHPKVDMGEPVFNYAVAYDTHNQEPLFYEKYPGSLNDISQLQFMLDKASGYGYKKIGFILDRGYFSCENIQYMDKCGYSFVIMVKGMSALVNELILENKGTFENKRVNNIYEYGVYGKTMRHKLYASDKKERYFHLYHSISKESAERIEIENRINQMTQYLKKYQNKVKEFGPGFEKYFNLHYDEKSQAFILPEERCSVVEAGRHKKRRDPVSGCKKWAVI